MRWCAEHLDFAAFHTVGAEPPTLFADASFDAVYAYSVVLASARAATSRVAWRSCAGSHGLAASSSSPSTGGASVEEIVSERASSGTRTAARLRPLRPDARERGFAFVPVRETHADARGEHVLLPVLGPRPLRRRLHPRVVRASALGRVLRSGGAPRSTRGMAGLRRAAAPPVDGGIQLQGDSDGDRVREPSRRGDTTTGVTEATSGRTPGAGPNRSGGRRSFRASGASCRRRASSRSRRDSAVCTQYLKEVCDELVVVDLADRCIDACKERFRAESHIRYHVNDGQSLDAIADGSIDFVFSYDSLVHAESDVLRAYLSQLGRKLAPDGAGFFHHSNLGSFRDPATGEFASRIRTGAPDDDGARLHRVLRRSGSLLCVAGTRRLGRRGAERLLLELHAKRVGVCPALRGLGEPRLHGRGESRATTIARLRPRRVSAAARRPVAVERRCRAPDAALRVAF